MDGFKRNLKTGVVEAWKDGEKVSEVVTTGDYVIRETEKRSEDKTMDAILEYKKRRESRLDEYQNGENWVTIRGVHVLLDKHGNVINNFKDPEHKLKNLRFVDAVSSHSEGGKKVVDAPIGRKTHEAKFGEAMGKIGESFGNGVIDKPSAQKRMSNALANLEQGAKVSGNGIKALKLGKGLFKVKGEKGNITAKQLAERMIAGVKVNELSGEVSGMPEVEAGTNTNVIQKGSKRITHVAQNALEDLYNKYKSNKFSREGLKKLSDGYVKSLPAGSVLNIGGNKFTKSSDGNWQVEYDGDSYGVGESNLSNILLNSMRTGYAGGTISADIPETSKATEGKVEKAAEKISKIKPKKTKPVSESLREIAKAAGSDEEKLAKITDFITGLPDGTSISYEGVSKRTGEPYIVKGVKEGDKIKFFKNEGKIKYVASTLLKKLMEGKRVGASDEEMFGGGEKAVASATSPKSAATEKMRNLASSIEVDSSKYTRDKVDTAKKEWDSPSHGADYSARYEKKSKAWYDALPERTRTLMTDYTDKTYGDINNALRDAGVTSLSPEQKANIEAMTDAIAGSKLEEDTFLRRGVSMNTFAQMFGLGKRDIKGAAGDAAKLEELLLGGIGVENGFASCGSAKGTGFKGREVDMEIFCPKGTEAVFANPFSAHKSSSTTSGELETILQRGSAFRVTGVKSERGKLTVQCEVVAQRKFVDSFGDSIEDELAA